MKKKIILVASGNGSNVENICNFFEQDSEVSIVAVFTNNPNAGVLKRVIAYGLKGIVFDKESFSNGKLLQSIKRLNPDLIVLAGFLWKIGADWIRFFPKKIINIHPSLLPKYGGKGMYGSNVHKAVKENRENETGITIHFVNKEYDKGDFLFQSRVKISENDTLNVIASKVSELEHLYFPKVINTFLKQNENEV